MFYVKITGSIPELKFEGYWEKDSSIEGFLERIKKKAIDLGLPVMVAIKGHGTFSISPRGQILHGALFDNEKLTKKSKSI